MITNLIAFVFGVLVTKLAITAEDSWPKRIIWVLVLVILFIAHGVLL